MTLEYLPDGYVLADDFDKYHYKIIKSYAPDWGEWDEFCYQARCVETDEIVNLREFYAHCRSWMRRNEDNMVTQNSDSEKDFQRGIENYYTKGLELVKAPKFSRIENVWETFAINGTAYMVTQCAEGESLSWWVENNGPFSANKILPEFYALMKDLQMLHEAGIIHGNIDPDKILYSNDKIKLRAFCFKDDTFEAAPMMIREGEIETRGWKNGFQAIESVQSKHDARMDIYSIAAVIYFCLTGQNLAPAIERVDYQATLSPKGLSRSQQAALNKALAVNPDWRFISMSMFREALQRKGWFDI